MSMTDPIADLFVRIKNAGGRGHETLQVPSSKMKKDLLGILKNEGYIHDFRLIASDGHPAIEVVLRYEPGRQKKSFITGIKRISKPGCRVYASADQLPRVMRGLGLAIITTDKGILTDEQCRKLKVGGEVLCHVW
ncbi:MAG: 30S ribosomal protein S8 [Nitrospira sp.]|nr:30S ribosomal protein S8 [Nitrospira sp.]MCA9474622.1 30S ribosomal protein S8 [Nitrospira sp.]MCA9479237.1 30S ribosomal protein S8 [Nitrospira sp.]MCB9709957.1 30S ribosomal protein S8 [Nitrospiraceae bacterium]MDR4487179.1 30S ribosomal protein S8 [Nitrospirales bacterium]